MIANTEQFASARTQERPSPPARYGSMKGAARRYGVSVRTIWRRAAAKEIVLVRLGQKPLVNFDATDALLRAAA